MTKAELLEILKLLSALEAWSFADKHRLPDHMLEQLSSAVEMLSAEVLK